MKELSGKVAVVTGAARGLGLSYAERLASLGADVAICDINLDSAQEYAAEKERLVNGSLDETLGAYGGRVFMQAVDMTDCSKVLAFFDLVHQEFGRIDIVVANAGGGGNFSVSASNVDEQELARVFERNLFSTIYTAKAVAPVMKAQKTGKIVNIASFVGTMALGPGNGADYAAAKASVAHYTRYLAQELAPFGINVNAIAPGFIATGQFESRLGKDNPERQQQWLESIPLGRFGKPADCTNLIQFLTTAASDYITGQVICIDGGLTRAPS